MAVVRVVLRFLVLSTQLTANNGNTWVLGRLEVVVMVVARFLTLVHQAHK